MSTTTDNLLTEEDRHVRYPVLASLSLDDTDLAELSHQGFICREKRGGRIYYKLRYRSRGRQVVRYIGNALRAAAVEGELLDLQFETAARRKLNAVVKVANSMLRDSKTQLEPILASHGFAFHGLSIRRVRKRPF
jgi:hypothetical protein